MKVKRLVASVVTVVAAMGFGGVALSQAALAQATVNEGEACPVAGATAVSSTSGRAIICTTLLDNGGGAGDLRWRVQTAANTPLDPTSTTVDPAAPPSTAVTTTTVSSTAPPTTAAPMPTTGVDSGRWGGEAASLVVLGVALVIAGRRRRRGFGSPA